MDDRTAFVRPRASEHTQADHPRFLKLHRRFPSIAYLRRHARRRLPSFAFEYLDGGAGADGGIARNWRALDAVELVPRYGVTTSLPPVDIELFGKRYAYRPTNVDEATLKDIAQRTGGEYFRARSSDELEEIYDLIDQMEKTEVKESAHVQYRELFHYFTYAGVLLLVLEMVLGGTYFRKLP